MKNLLPASLLALLTSNVFANQCDINQQQLIANYQIDNNNVSTEMQLVRYKNQVAHVYPEKNITDVWLQYRNEKIAMNRYFDQPKRAIEYQPTELKRTVNWEKQSQLITSEQIKEMTLVTEMGSGCYKQQEYNLTKGDVTVRLSWYPKLKLVKRLHVSHNGKNKIWNLQNIDASDNAVHAFFTQRYTYQTTDYADIGDNESDPFLTKMINLGFVEHKEQGFYNTEGENIAGGHHDH